MQSQIGLIGVGLMGENLVLNMESKGFSVSVFDISRQKVENFVSGRGNGKRIQGCFTVEELIASLVLPRKIMLMVPAGKAVDEIIETLVPLLAQGDIIIDGGNSHFPDTSRRTKMLESKGLLYVGAGVSGGEEGALLGPSIMPGGSVAAWESVKPIFQAIAAKVDGDVPCCDWIGEEGAGHFVKMVHNGIEYGDMQLICEVYDLMKNLLRMTPGDIHDVFKSWNEGELKSYLIEITRDILAVRDDDGLPLLDKILDKAAQKGTGKWAVNTSLDLATPLTLITESVFARVLSSMKDERVVASRLLSGPKAEFSGDKKAFIEDIGHALYAAKLVSYTQGYQLMRAAAKEFGWKLNFGGIALIWRGGCIIRSAFLGKIKEAFVLNPDLVNLLLDPFFKDAISKSQQSLRTVLAEAIKNGVPTPALSSALAYYDGYRCESLPANLLQAQRDFFGAHQYERVDKPRGEYFHTNWTGRGGATASTVYSG
ncbi:MAG: decarboxylating NADP(+)-dependent phosphogluconate dehydrogenase [Rhodoferax sp.]|uniref:decarboxylating NADP(+)-dependent phosphogluconate dehydrogenase n=1 Tax=Rhodoferax sp. TaxID=50421 RepID=UPI0027308011|nr:decarboxylating NADP(+)-dependent phosphogluconate dehydrogenase [Rhodoferax sp.]MDP1528083.1 decarboxylating NADP(+)-dependent phosphogluconate dehydrogenase [Rhodoferax sp.]MDP1944084.1 decarboxylating NADP(+)-dependent phosphogluconate dehydrogenase [Rhodoferax sp.]